MKIYPDVQLDPEVNALYLEFFAGEVARTLELAEGVYLDLDEENQPIGLEFIDMEAFENFLARNGGEIVIPEIVESRDSLDLSPA